MTELLHCAVPLKWLLAKIRNRSDLELATIMLEATLKVWNTLTSLSKVCPIWAYHMDTNNISNIAFHRNKMSDSTNSTFNIFGYYAIFNECSKLQSKKSQFLHALNLLDELRQNDTSSKNEYVALPTTILDNSISMNYCEKEHTGTMSNQDYTSNVENYDQTNQYPYNKFSHTDNTQYSELSQINNNEYTDKSYVYNSTAVNSPSVLLQQLLNDIHRTVNTSVMSQQSTPVKLPYVLCRPSISKNATNTQNDILSNNDVTYDEHIRLEKLNKSESYNCQGDEVNSENNHSTWDHDASKLHNKLFEVLSWPEKSSKNVPNDIFIHNNHANISYRPLENQTTPLPKTLSTDDFEFKLTPGKKGPDKDEIESLFLNCLKQVATPSTESITTQEHFPSSSNSFSSLPSPSHSDDLQDTTRKRHRIITHYEDDSTSSNSYTEMFPKNQQIQSLLSPCQGVCWDPTHQRWVAHWSDAKTHHRIRKYFNPKINGFNKARLLAVLTRKEAVESGKASMTVKSVHNSAANNKKKSRLNQRKESSSQFSDDGKDLNKLYWCSVSNIWYCFWRENNEIQYKEFAALNYDDSVDTSSAWPAPNAYQAALQYRNEFLMR